MITSRLARPVRGVLAGTAGTATLTAAYGPQCRRREPLVAVAAFDGSTR